MTFESHGITSTGKVRSDNQDRILVEPDLGLYGVFDGMGGQQRGDLAAQVAATVVHNYVASSRNPSDVTWPFGYNYLLSIEGNRLLTSVKLANRQVWRRAEQDLDAAGMGATIAAVLVSKDQASVANVGDSRIYRLRGGALEQLSVDDNVVSIMLEKGLIAPEQVRMHPMRTVLTQAAGSKEGVEVHLRDEALEPGDVFLVSSDGLHGFVDDSVIAGILGQGGPIEDCAAALMEAAEKSDSSDNVSVVVLRCVQL
jgi:serine/threonine protein phosphatase PrpC